MDSAHLLESARRQTSSMALSGNLSSGQSYYTVESLEGASSLPPLQPSFSAALLPSDRGSLLGLDARTRAFLADRDAADARARLLAAERESLLRRDVFGADGLTSLDEPSRFDGILPFDARARHSFDELQGFDPRTRALGLDRRSQDAFRPGIDDRTRSFAPSGERAQGLTDQRSDMIHARELAAARSSFLPSTDYRRDIEDVRSPALPSHSSFPRRESLNRAGATFPGGARSIHARKQEPPAPRPAHIEATRNQGKDTSSSKTLPSKPKTRSPPGMSEGWCAVCKIDCPNAKTLSIHVSGKKHKAMVEGNLFKLKGPSDEGKSTPAGTSQAEKKRVSDAKPEALRDAKRLKASDAAVENGALLKAAGSILGKADESKKEKQLLTCEICNVFTTGQFNLDAHLKGRRHAARVKELAYRQVAK